MATTTERGARGIWAAVTMLSGISTIVRAGGEAASDPMLALVFAALTGLAALRFIDTVR